MLCPGPGATVNNIARYNVSVNDGKYDGAPVIRMGTGKYGSLGVQIYNNTIYWENNGGYTMSLTPDSYWEGPNIKEVSVFNNIFYGPAKADSMSTKEGITYSNNLVYSSDGSAEAVYEALANDAHAVYADPQFADVTDYTAGSWQMARQRWNRRRIPHCKDITGCRCRYGNSGSSVLHRRYTWRRAGSKQSRNPIC